jgi:exopolysaccharide biosynthesis predicted pyruvyltransferase EpsI
MWMRPWFRRSLYRSRAKLLASLSGARRVTFVRSWGNLGDELIYAGTRQLLAGVAYEEVSLRAIEGIEGDLAVVSGGGAWCQPFHEVLPAALLQIESRFHRVVVFPSSFDTRVGAVREALLRTRAVIFAREPESYRLIRGLCDAELAHDCAFFFDYRPYRRRGSGLLVAFRTDAESTQTLVPEANRDVSVTCTNLGEWIGTIAAHEEVYTDRAHVMVAAAMLGKRVRYRSSSYHKVPAIAEWALRGLPVGPLDPLGGP